MDGKERQGHKMQSYWKGIFSQDVVNEILVCLPVKSLLRFKCVCKHWFAVIHSSGFVTKHFNHKNNRTRLLLYYTSSNDGEGVSLLPDEILVGIPSSNDAIDYIQCPQVIEHLIGPIDGLFFLQSSGFESSGPMALWNPSMREFRPLPVPTITSPYFFAIHTFGFGLDPLTCTYKVIWIRFLMDTRTENPLPYFVVAVYTLGSNTWRYLDPLIRPRYDLRNSLSATCINGTYYWLASHDHFKHSILSFDMSREVFKDLAGPDYPDGTWGSLTLCNASVALFLCQYGVYYQSLIVLCMMKDEGCWDKLITIEPSVESRPLGLWNNKDVLLESSSSELFMYMRDTHEIRSIGIFGDSKKVFSYKESLLSVKGQSKDPNECNFSDTLGDDHTFTLQAAGDKALVDKTEELGKLVGCFFLEQDFYYRQARFHDEYENVGGIPEDLAKGWPMIIDDPERLETFFSLDEAQRSLYVAQLVRGG